MTHISVLLHESIDGLDIKPGDVFVDCTLGQGGHTEEVYKRFGNTVAMIGIDLDLDAIERTKNRLPKDCNVKYSLGSFKNIDKILDSMNIGNVDKVIMDIGLSSNQFEESGRGFSFQRDEPLIMSFVSDNSSQPSGFTAKDIVNEWDEENIESILRIYGEEKFAGKIARAIVDRRKIKPIDTTFELVQIIRSATPSFYHHRKIHLATKTFQALRITVNDEIENLKIGTKKAFDRLNKNGRLAVISFHSLEDRIVKKFFKELIDSGEGIRVTKKPIIPSDEEIQINPRSRSAKLRIIEKK
jgi:16S rRNA (cytosine1402-N4)-methyltransferase